MLKLARCGSPEHEAVKVIVGVLILELFTCGLVNFRPGFLGVLLIKATSAVYGFVEVINTAVKKR